MVRNPMIPVLALILSLAAFAPVWAASAGTSAPDSLLWIDGTHAFQGAVERLADAAAARRAVRRGRGPVPTPREYAVGDAETFWVCDFTTNTFATMTARVAVIGRNCRLFLEAGREIPLASLNALVADFDDKIHPAVTACFGDEWKPGIDGDEKIALLLMDIKDGSEANPGRGYVAGYFNPADESLESELPVDTKLKSNQREMLYLDCNPADINSAGFRGIIAHELQHMIHHRHDPREATWVNEGCSQMAAFVAGFGHPSQITAFLRTPDNSLTTWSPWQMLANYGQVYLWNAYVAGRFLPDETARRSFFRSLVADPERGIQGWENALKPFNVSFPALFAQFCTALACNKPAWGAEFGFAAPGLETVRLPAATRCEALPALVRDGVYLWSADLIEVDLRTVRGGVRVDFAGDRTSLKNLFTVRLLLCDSRGQRAPSVLTIDNIKPTTPERRAEPRPSQSPIAAMLGEIAPVMLPGSDDPYPLPPSDIRTQMGFAEIADTMGYDTLQVLVIAMPPAGTDETLYTWEPRQSYRLDVSAMAPRPVIAGPVASRPSGSSDPSILSGLITRYLEIAGTAADGTALPESTRSGLEAMASQIRAEVRNLAESGSPAAIEEVLENASCGTTPAGTALRETLRDQLRFADLHRRP